VKQLVLICVPVSVSGFSLLLCLWCWWVLCQYHWHSRQI